MTRKKIPGKGWDYMVYNAIDQLVASQDSMQKTNSQWIFTKYDGEGKVIQTGIWSSADDQAAAQTAVNAVTTLWEVAQNSGNGYTNNAWPASSVGQTLTLNYYDGYTNIPGLPVAYSAPTGASIMTRGLVTATLTNVLNTTNMLWTVHYYDDKGRLIQSYGQHYLGGGTADPGNYDIETNTYDFTNAITATNRQHYNVSGGSSALAVTVGNTYTYDHVGRKRQTFEQINSGTNVLLNQVDYNEVGQVMTKHLYSENSGTSWLQNIAYLYNERGWLTQNSAPLLNEQLRYNYGSSPLYNGNITEMQYSASNGGHTFDYTYDLLNRLTISSATGGTLSEGINYDYLGNIINLTRGGQPYTGSLTYAYTGNHLTGVTGTGFAGRTYSYDGNGNATTDGAVSSPKTISYNILNLPKSLTQSSSTIATYVYDAEGTKLRNTSVADSTWDYVSGIVYRNNNIAYIQTEDGRAIKEGTTYAYQYDLKDHLGNNRVVFDKGTSGTARELQEDEYYAFGLRNNLFGSNNSNRYLYNGKEIQADLTNQYDYGARFYDPVIGRWNTLDPLAEVNRRWTPYNYASNNPLNKIDPDGMVDIEVTGAYGAKETVSSFNYWSADGVVSYQGKNFSGDAFESGHAGLIEAQDKGTEEGLKDSQALKDKIFGAGDSNAGDGPGDPPKKDANQGGLKNMTITFDKQLQITKSFFSSIKNIYSSLDPASQYPAKLMLFTELVKTHAPFDLKNGDYKSAVIGYYSLWHGEQMQFGDYGQINYGVAARAFGINLDNAIHGAGLNQILQGKPNWKNTRGWFDGPGETELIIRGYNLFK